MGFKNKAETYLLLHLERCVLELRHGKWLDRKTSSRILKWIDAGLRRQSEAAAQRGAAQTEQRKTSA
jgi:hypothetical protein